MSKLFLFPFEKGSSLKEKIAPYREDLFFQIWIGAQEHKWKFTQSCPPCQNWWKLELANQS